MSNILQRFNNIETFIFDVDGVFTDSSLIVTEEGHLLRVMNARDGYALHHAMEKGYQIVIITGGNSEGVRMRLEALGTKHVYIAVRDKLKLYRDLVEEGTINPDTSIYMGDDIPDLAVMNEIPMSACPNDAAEEIVAISDYVSPIAGGKGAVRDLIQTVLKVQKKWL